MRLDNTYIRKGLDKVVSIRYEVSDIQLKAGDENGIRTFGLSVRLRVMGLFGASLQPEERTKPRKAIVYHLGPTVRQ